MVKPQRNPRPFSKILVVGCFLLARGPAGVAFAGSEVSDQKSPAGISYYETRRKSEEARIKVEGFGLVLKTEIDSSHYVVHWALGENSRADGNAKNEFADALRDLRNALVEEGNSLRQSFGNPKNKNELIFTADILGRRALVDFTLDSVAGLSSFNAGAEWALRANSVITLPQVDGEIPPDFLIVKCGHFDPAHFDWNPQSAREVVKLSSLATDVDVTGGATERAAKVSGAAPSEAALPEVPKPDMIPADPTP